MTLARISMYATAMVACALTASASMTLTIVAIDAEGLPTAIASVGGLKPTMPKPANHCPTCQDAKDTLSIANGE